MWIFHQKSLIVANHSSIWYNQSEGINVALKTPSTSHGKHTESFSLNVAWMSDHADYRYLENLVW